MLQVARPRRSVLYMPGSNPRALEKAQSLPADALILDLEDAVSPDAKAAARQLVCEAVTSRPFGKREVIIRVNALDTDWGETDLNAVAGVGADAILLPKVNGATDVHAAEAVLKSAGLSGETTLWCMMETPRGILHAEEIAGASERLAGFVMGTSDLVKDLHARHTPMRLPVLASLHQCILAARAEGLTVLDGVYLDLNDEEGLVASCEQGVDLGFDGKTLIHPKQIAAANHVFAPSDGEIDFSRRIIAAHAEAMEEGKGVVLVDGKLIEALHVEDAHRLVALSDAIADMESAST